MNLADIMTKLNLSLLTEPTDFTTITPNGGYTSDLLSCVMAGAKSRNIWVTLQAHGNIVAVAALLDLSAIIITEGATPDKVTIDKANKEGVNLLSTHLSSYETVGKLWEIGLT
jgi:imidazolonepropionase-like amidohydrolase